MSLEVDRILSVVPENFVVFEDSRDRVLATSLVLPPIIDLSNFDSPVQMQDVGSCTADAATNLFENLLNQKSEEYMVDLSRLFLYWFSRRYTRAHTVDAGSSLRMTIRALANIGVCAEKEFPYDAINVNVEPSDAQIAGAATYKITEYYSIRSPQEMMNSLAQGLPVAFATTALGGVHALLAVGYDLNARTFKCKNSFGPTYGDKGYAYIGFEQMEGMFDAWTFKIDTTNMPKTKRPATSDSFWSKFWKWIETYIL